MCSCDAQARTESFWLAFDGHVNPDGTFFWGHHVYGAIGFHPLFRIHSLWGAPKQKQKIHEDTIEGLDTEH